MPTDDVLTLIAEVRKLCDAMPEGPYEYGSTIIDEYGTTIWYPFVSPHPDFVERYQARYFAALDPALVRALLDYVRSDLALRGVIDSLHGGSRARLTAAEDDFEAADVALRALAAERVTD